MPDADDAASRADRSLARKRLELGTPGSMQRLQAPFASDPSRPSSVGSWTTVQCCSRFWQRGIVPLRTTIEDVFEVEVFRRDEAAPGSLNAWREQYDDPRVFAAVVGGPVFGRVEALAVWPSDIPPPDLADDFPAALRRDAVLFVQPGVSICRACKATVEGLFVLGRLWFGGNRRRHKMARCPQCDADFVHSGFALLSR